MGGPHHNIDRALGHTAGGSRVNGHGGPVDIETPYLAAASRDSSESIERRLPPMATVRYRPGEACPEAGRYTLVRWYDGYATGREVVVARGDLFPPVPQPGLAYVLADPTH